MPTYTVHDYKKSETYDVLMPYAELEEFLEKFPHIQRVVTAPAVISGTSMEGKMANSGFNEVLQKVAEAHPGSAVADKVGDNRSIKQKKTIETVAKHVVKQQKEKERNVRK